MEQSISIISMARLLFLALALITLTACDASEQSKLHDDLPATDSQEAREKIANRQLVNIKYREDPVDVAGFDYLNTPRSSFVRGAWYDSDNQYMIINLNGTNYHYCGLPKSTWRKFSRSDSFGRSYNQTIKNRYDCRINPVPNYD